MKKNNTKKLSLQDLATGQIYTDVYVESRDLKDKKEKYKNLGRLYLTFEPEYLLIDALSVSARQLYDRLKHWMTVGNHVYRSRQQIAESLDINIRTLNRYFAELISRDVIAGEGHHYMLNPKYVLNGRGETKDEVSAQYWQYKERIAQTERPSDYLAGPPF